MEWRGEGVVAGGRRPLPSLRPLPGKKHPKGRPLLLLIPGLASSSLPWAPSTLPASLQVLPLYPRHFQTPTSLQKLSVGWGQDLSSLKTLIRGAEQGCCSIPGPDPRRLEPVSTPPFPPVTPSLPEPSHLVSAAALLCSALCSALHCFPAPLRVCLPPPSSNPWLSPTGQTGGTVATYRRLCGLCPKDLSCSLASAQPGVGGMVGGGKGRESRSASLLAAGQGAWREEFLFLCAGPPHPSCPSSCSPLSHCRGFVLAQGGEG